MSSPPQSSNNNHTNGQQDSLEKNLNPSHRVNNLQLFHLHYFSIHLIQVQISDPITSTHKVKEEMIFLLHYIIPHLHNQHQILVLILKDLLEFKMWVES